jgi:hypothetical protein
MTASRIYRRKGAKNLKLSRKVPNAMDFANLTEIEAVLLEAWLSEPAYFLHQ